MQQMNQYAIGEFVNNQAENNSGNANHKNDSNLTLIQMNHISFDDQDSDIEEVVEHGKNEYFFKKDLATEAKFELDINDWSKLKSLQMGHRFQKGEWEDYFVAGMKQSNRYCVFAFKDHYVNRACVRKRKASMNTFNGANDINESEEKLFTAKGYCVFKDCSITFYLKMNAERIVHVKYMGELKHCVTHVNGRYFRGKSRHELKEILKRTQKPKKEFLQRVQSHAQRDHLESNNVDYIGKTYSVYKRISSEAKDWFHSLLALQNEFIVNEQGVRSSNECVVKGFIQVIQILPSCIICFGNAQINLFKELIFFKQQTKSLRDKPVCLFIGCHKTKSLVSTKFNKKNVKFYEMCLRKIDEKNNTSLIPLTALFKTDSTPTYTLFQWLSKFFDATFQFESNKKQSLYIVCDNSMALVKAILKNFSIKSLSNYANQYFKKAASLNKSNQFETSIISLNDIDHLNKQVLLLCDNKSSLENNDLFIHTCTIQFMNELKNLCHFYFAKYLSFAMDWFSILVNSQTLIEFEQILAAFMCVLYSKNANILVKNALEFSKVKQSLNFETQKKTKKNSKYFDNEFSIHKNPSNSDFVSSGSTCPYVGLRALQRTQQSLSLTKAQQLEDGYLDELNSDSMFFKMCEKLFEKVRLKCDQIDQEENGESNKNIYQSHELLHHFLRQFTACIPFWANGQIFLEENHWKIPTNLNHHDERIKKFIETFPSNTNNNESLDTLIKHLYNESKLIIEPFSRDINTNVMNESSGFKRLNYFSPIDILIASKGDNINQESIDDIANEDTLISKRVVNKINLDLTSSVLSKGVKKLKISKISDCEKECQENAEKMKMTIVVLDTNKDGHQHEEEEIIIRRSHQILTNAFGLELTKDDIDSLENFKLPNSNIIEFYLKYLEIKKNSYLKRKEVYILPVRFYPTLKYGQTIANVSRDSNIQHESFDIFEYNLVLIPIHKTTTDHWALAAINLKKKSVVYYDSSLNDDYDCLKYLKEYLDLEYFRYYQSKIDLSDWKFLNEKNITEQKNQRECAIYLLLYAKSLIENQSLLFEEVDLENFINKLKHEINDQLNK